MRRVRELDDPRRRVVVRALSLGVFAAGMPGGSALAQGLLRNPPSKLPPGQSIYRISGQATVNGKEADLKTPIAPGDTVKTSNGGEIVFVVGSNAMLARGGTTVTIERGEDAGILVSGLRILAGALLSVSRDTPMKVRTATATMGIRGTGFYVESNPDQTYFCTCYGVADIAANADPESRDTVAATHHDRPVYIVANATTGKSIRNAGSVINHTDQELALIEALVGRTPPFVFPRDSYGATQ